MPDADSADLPHLLVVDDSRLMRRAIIKILGDEYRITEAADGEEGWKLLQQHEDVRIVFSDLSMPVLDGFGLLDRIRNSEDARIRDTAVIIITGAEDDDATKNRALSAGASDFISKPFESVQLRSRAKTHIKLETTNRKLSQTTVALETTSTIDTLTGLANKAYFEERGNKDLALAKRHRGELALLRIDIDNFNNLFTKHGKEPASHILKQVCDALKENVRREDTLARIGVAKLAFIMPQTNRVGARQVGERIRQQLADIQFEYGGFALPTTVSIGVAALDITPNTAFAEFVSLAENHLAIAVEAGGNRLVADASDGLKLDVEQAVVEEQTQPAILETVVEPVIEIESMPDIETALLRIENDEQDSLNPYLALLLRRTLPLLELANRKLQLGIDDAIEKIRSHAQQGAE